VLVSGRFHHTIAAACLNTPFVLLGSNTPKNAGLAETLGVPAPLALDSPGFVEALISRTEAAREGGSPPEDEGARRAAGLRELALENFSGLPAAEAARETHLEVARPGS
jgi:polysaccharide pyruvyl transferase WcaK-like protein